MESHTVELTKSKRISQKALQELVDFRIAIAAKRKKRAQLKQEISSLEYDYNMLHGEVVDLLKKYVYHKHPLSVGEMEKELGDVMWYVAALASTFNLDLGNICQKNIEKLKRRYPDKFDAELSRNRNE